MVDSSDIGQTPTARSSTPWPDVTPEEFPDLYAAFLVWRNDRSDVTALDLGDQLTMFGKELAEDE